MINFEALFKISYGLYIVSSGDRVHGNGFISNTVFQVTAEPICFAACCNKNNYTSEFIKSTELFAVSVLHKDASPEIFGRFGYKSGKDFNKLEGMNIIYGDTGVPIVLNDSIAFLECKLTRTFDVGSHFIFIGELIQSQIIDDTIEPITYSYYRQVRKGVAPKNAPTYIDKSKYGPERVDNSLKKYKCGACGYIYDESVEKVRFKDLSDDWICPVCGSEKSEFYETDN
jgi:flavin reductase (DIM6/NTAB) family NADH-FMN oxidoreductase RutF/rubredoxin